MSADARVEALAALLRGLDVGTGASVAGAQGDIAVVHGARPSAVLPHADRILALGFRHVTVDLATLPREADS